MDIETLQAFLFWCLLVNTGIYALTAIAVLLLRDVVCKIHKKIFGLDEETVSKSIHTYGPFGKKCPMLKPENHLFYSVFRDAGGTFFMGRAILPCQLRIDGLIIHNHDQRVGGNALGRRMAEHPLRRHLELIIGQRGGTNDRRLYVDLLPQES